MLNDIHCRKAQPRDKPYKLTDGAGLFLLVNPGGTRKTEGLKHWRFAYRFDGKQKLLSFGVYPDVTLVEARRSRQVAREQLAVRLPENGAGIGDSPLSPVSPVSPEVAGGCVDP